MKGPLAATVGILVASALVVGPIALARRTSEPEPEPAGRILTAVETASRERDVRPAAASIGDEFLLRQQLSEDGVELGGNESTCTYVRRTVLPDPPPPRAAISVQCTGTAQIGPDILTYQGLNTFAPGSSARSRFVVTGGTGAFAGATGELEITETGPGASTLLLAVTGQDAR